MVDGEENVRRLSHAVSRGGPGGAGRRRGGDALALALLGRQGRIRLTPPRAAPVGSMPRIPALLTVRSVGTGAEREGPRCRWLTENRLECRRGARCFEVPMAALIALTLLPSGPWRRCCWPGCASAGVTVSQARSGKAPVNEVMDSIDGPLRTPGAMCAASGINIRRNEGTPWRTEY